MDECLQKKALITGITCQDGSYLPEPLLNKGYEVHGINRRSSNLNTERLRHIYVGPETSDSRIKLQYGDRPDASSLRNWIDKICLDEVYHLDAQSHVVVSFKNLEYTADVVATGALRLLQAVQSHIEAINRKQIFINLYNRQNVRLIVCTQKTSACLRPRTSACLRPTQNVGERERERDRGKSYKEEREVPQKSAGGRKRWEGGICSRRGSFSLVFYLAGTFLSIDTCREEVKEALISEEGVLRITKEWGSIRHRTVGEGKRRRPISTLALSSLLG